jgi:hypothetical protein
MHCCNSGRSSTTTCPEYRGGEGHLALELAGEERGAAGLQSWQVGREVGERSGGGFHGGRKEEEDWLVVGIW